MRIDQARLWNGPDFFVSTSPSWRDIIARRTPEICGAALLLFTAFAFLAFASWHVDDPSLHYATAARVKNIMGFAGAAFADLGIQLLGFAVIGLLIPPACWGWRLLTRRGLNREALRAAAWPLGFVFCAAFFSYLPTFAAWPLPSGLGGVVGDGLRFLCAEKIDAALGFGANGFTAFLCLALGAACLVFASAAFAPAQDRDDGVEALGLDVPVLGPFFGLVAHWCCAAHGALLRWREAGAAPQAVAQTRAGAYPDLSPRRGVRREPHFHIDTTHLVEPDSGTESLREEEDDGDSPQDAFAARITPATRQLRKGRREGSEAQGQLLRDSYTLPPLALLTAPKRAVIHSPDTEALEGNVKLLEDVLDDFGVKGEIIHVRPGPVVTLYELQPAPGIKSARVISLADDIARSMSAISARVAVVPGRNVIGIELPNARRETVYLRELLASKDFEDTKARLALCMGKTIGGEPVIADLARMPHLLIAGTTGSGKSVAINTMILSLLYRLTPAQCKLIMIDPKMLELSMYDGIPHLLSPVVTDPKKAVVALKWTVREMEERYRKMSKLGVRNIDGYNARMAQALESGETLTRTVQTGFDRETGQAVYEHETMAPETLPYIVVIVDEMADLMLVAGKEIEGTVQRLAQMARAAGIHIIMATQRPSVDVITGTIKANFPTRVSFQVTSKIDSRTILGEQGAEQLLGQGDMLYMAGGGRISRVHGPFVTDEDVEKIVKHLKAQGTPAYLEAITAEADSDEDDSSVFDTTAFGGSEGVDLYAQAVAVVLRDKKASTSYIQRRLQVGYNKAASLIERMEHEGIVSPANGVGKREILVEGDTAEAV